MAVTLKIEGLGYMKFELAVKETPITCYNFLALCASEYYTGTKIHRNIRGFMVQGGDPTGTGKGGESIYGRPFDDEIRDELRHDKRAILSMANSGPNKNQSQFFITYAKHTTLDNKFTVFGQLVDGYQTLDLLEKEPVDKNNRPLNELVISEVVVNANPIADMEWDLEQEAKQKAEQELQKGEQVEAK